jgi:hypothetical protein
MGKREDNRRIKMINEVFKDVVDLMEIQTSMGPVKLISLEEIPLLQMQEIMENPGEGRMMLMVDAFQLCLVNPEDWENKFVSMSMKELNRVLQQWMSTSSRLAKIGSPENENENESGEF